MKCLEFKRLALSDPNSTEHEFILHHQKCAECLKYVKEVRQMDANLATSLEVDIPSDLVARLQLTQEMQEQNSNNSYSRYAIAASFALAMFVAGFFVSNQYSFNQGLSEDYQSLLSGVTEHMGKQAFTPVWKTDRANSTVATLLASYDDNVRLKQMPNLTFGRICPMGKYRGLHASLETDEGQVTFAYIKGEPVGEILDKSYQGFVTRIKPLRGGNLIIVSKTVGSMQQADQQLEQAIYWDI